MGRMRALILLAALTLARLSFAYQFQAIASLAPLLTRLFGLDYTAIGTLIGIHLASGILMSLPFGMLAGRFGDRVVLTAGLLLMTVGALIAATGGGVAGIAAGRVVSGMGSVTIVVLQGKLLADWFEGSAFMLAIAVTMGSYAVGISLAQFTQLPLAEAAGWPWVFVAGGAIAAAAATLFLSAYQPPEERGRRSLALPSPRECMLVAVAGLIWTFYNAGYSGFLSYVPSLLHVRAATAAQAGVVIALATLTNLPAMLDGSVIIALGTLSSRPERRAAGMGLFYTTYYIGGALIPAACGRAADIYGGPEGALYAAAAVSLLSIPAFFAHRALAHRPAAAALRAA